MQNNANTSTVLYASSSSDTKSSIFSDLPCKTDISSLSWFWKKSHQKLH